MKAETGGQRGSGGVGGRSAKTTAENVFDRIEAGIDDSEVRYLRGGMRDLAQHQAAFEGRNANDVATGKINTNEGRKFEPIRIEVVTDGGKVKIHLEDGRHRLQAAHEAGATRIRAKVSVGTHSQLFNGRAKTRTLIIPIPKK